MFIDIGFKFAWDVDLLRIDFFIIIVIVIAYLDLFQITDVREINRPFIINKRNLLWWSALHHLQILPASFDLQVDVHIINTILLDGSFKYIEQFVDRLFSFASNQQIFIFTIFVFISKSKPELLLLFAKDDDLVRDEIIDQFGIS